MEICVPSQHFLWGCVKLRGTLTESDSGNTSGLHADSLASSPTLNILVFEPVESSSAEAVFVSVPLYE